MMHASGTNWELHQGGCLDVMRGLPDASVHCCVTSPPYWGLRDYGTESQVWGGAQNCDHEWRDTSYVRRTSDGGTGERQQIANIGSLDRDKPVRNAFCVRCGAWRGELGLEPTPDLYAEHLVLVFREVRRLLRPDGTLWLNLGDSYAGSWGNYSPHTAVPSEGWSGTRFKRAAYDDRTWRPANSLPQKGLKAKDLVGIPWRVALALQADGWYLRSDIVWAKENCMPESVRDRPTRAHEYVFLLARSERYFYDADAVSEPMKVSSMTRVQTGWNGDSQRGYTGGGPQNHLGKYMGGEYARTQTRRNRRTVWSIATKPYKGAHFAVFPPKLAEPCILAGTSADGCCVRCGAPRKRRVAVRRGEPDNTGRTHSLPEQRLGKAPAPERGWETARTTLGWEPACSCSDAGVVPCVVLDPFAGSGTAGAVCLEHGRRFIGIELNPAYCELAAARLRDAESKTAQRELPACATGSE